MENEIMLVKVAPDEWRIVPKKEIFPIGTTITLTQEGVVSIGYPDYPEEVKSNDLEWSAHLCFAAVAVFMLGLMVGILISGIDKKKRKKAKR